MSADQGQLAGLREYSGMETLTPEVVNRKRKGRSLHNRGCDQSLIRKYILMNGNG